jgi:GT2 family glycosyltransferase
MSESAIDIIAVSYFGADDAEHLVESLLKQTFLDWHLMIVDNSLDDLEESKLHALAKNDARIRILSPRANLGYFGAAQFALATSTPLGDVVVMNTDIVFGGPDVLGDLRREADGAQDVGVLAPAIISGRTGRDQNPHLTEKPTVRAAARRRWATATPLSAQLSIWASDLRRRGRGGHSEPATDFASKAIYAAHGSFLYFTRSYFASSGDFRHPLFLFGEEIYVAEHAHRHDLRVLYVPRIIMKHVEHGTMGIKRSRALLKMSGLATKYALESAKRASGTRPSA